MVVGRRLEALVELPSLVGVLPFLYRLPITVLKFAGWVGDGRVPNPIRGLVPRVAMFLVRWWESVTGV